MERIGQQRQKYWRYNPSDSGDDAGNRPYGYSNDGVLQPPAVMIYVPVSSLF